MKNREECEVVGKFQRIAAEIKANARWRRLLASTWSDEQDALQAIAKKYSGIYTATGGGIYVVLIPLGPHDCMGVSAECCCRYTNEKLTDPYQIFWEPTNDTAKGMVALCD